MHPILPVKVCTLEALSVSQSTTSLCKAAHHLRKQPIANSIALDLRMKSTLLRCFGGFASATAISHQWTVCGLHTQLLKKYCVSRLCHVPAYLGLHLIGGHSHHSTGQRVDVGQSTTVKSSHKPGGFSYGPEVRHLP